MLGGTMDEEKQDDIAVGMIPGNTQVLSDLMESDDELSKQISYLMGGVEHYHNHNQRTRFPLAISVEDASFDIKTIIERILKYLVNLTKDVFDGSMLASLAIEGVISRAENLLLDGRTAKRNHKTSNFVISTRIQNLSVRYKAISDPQQLLIQLKVLGRVVSAIMTYMTYTVYTGYEALINFNPLDESLDKVAGEILVSSPAILKNDILFKNNGYTIESPQLLGCQKLVVNNTRHDSSLFERALGASMALFTAESEPLPLPMMVKFDRFSLSLEKSLLTEVISVATTISKVNTLNRRTNRRNKLMLITSRISDMNRLIDESPRTEGEVKNIRGYISLLETYSGWITTPYVSLIALTQRNLTAILNVCEGNAK